MALILYIETATSICSVTLAINSTILAMRESNQVNDHAEKITLFIDEVMKITGIPMSRIDAVAVSKGPGSYTGLRIGVSTAKAICFALDKPLISVGTLHAIAFGAQQNYSANMSPETLICPMIDARRMEVYYALFNEKLHLVSDIQAKIITTNTFSELFPQHKLLLVGNGAEKCKTLFDDNLNITIINDFILSSKYMILQALHDYENNVFESTAYFEPYYLKEFIAGPSKVKGLK